MYSALKVNGKKLCDLARAGIEVERKARTVFLYQIEILDITLPRVHMRVSCSKGTYIRTLCQDIGERLGCGACMESLVRTRVSDFTLKEAKTLTEIETLVKAGRLEEVLQPVDIVFLQLKKAVVYNQFQALLYNGNKMAVSCCALMEGTEELEQIRVYDENNQFVGIYQYLKEEELLKPVKLFME